MLLNLSVKQSMSMKGDPYDNAVAENFFSCLKCEMVYLSCFKTRDEAKQAVFRCMDGYYNAVRPHSSIGYVSPMEYAKRLVDVDVA